MNCCSKYILAPLQSLLCTIYAGIIFNIGWLRACSGVWTPLGSVKCSQTSSNFAIASFYRLNPGMSESERWCNEEERVLANCIRRVFIFVLLGKTSVDKPLLEYVSKKLNSR